MKAYWLAHMTVHDAASYADYAQAATAVFDRFGGKVLARGGKARPLEGRARPRHVIIEFPSLEAAMRCYRSVDYQAARTHRDGAGEGEIVIVEGLMEEERPAC